MAGVIHKIHQSDPGNRGSALILTVVLTSLLAMVGVLFVLVSRLDRTATQATEDARQLDSAVDRVLGMINEELVSDVPGVSGQEYYDAPDANNAWLASLEPRIGDDDRQGVWDQISDITGGHQTQIVIEDRTDPDLGDADYALDGVIKERKVIDVNLPLQNDLLNQLADADGDGIADAKWFVLDRTDPYKPVLAAVRVLDHAGELNLNAHYAFHLSDPNAEPNLNGAHVGQIDLLGLVDPNVLDVEATFWSHRLGTFKEPNLFDIYNWQREVVWNWDQIDSSRYTPFDLSDELRLRYRFLLNYENVNTRIENLWPNVFETGPSTPMMHRKFAKDAGDYDLDRWLKRSGALPGDYDYRHVTTTYNMDRQLTPQGDTSGMLNINHYMQAIQQAWQQYVTSQGTGNTEQVYQDLIKTLVYTIELGIDPRLPERRALAAQFAVNLIDFVDMDDESVTVWLDPENSNQAYYGFERQPFIKQLRVRIDAQAPDVNNVNGFLVELYNPFTEPLPMSGLNLELTLGTGDGDSIPPINLTDVSGNSDLKIAARGSFYLVNNNEAADLLPDGVTIGSDEVLLVPDMKFATYRRQDDTPVLDKYYNLSLFHVVKDAQAQDMNLYLDHQVNDQNDFAFDKAGGKVTSFLRGSVSDWRVINPVWQDKVEGAAWVEPNAPDPNSTLAHYNLADPNTLLRVPQPSVQRLSRRFVRVGDILRVLTIGPGTTPEMTVGQQLYDAGDVEENEKTYRFDLRVEDRQNLPNNPYAGIFQYLTALDPVRFTGEPNDVNELRVKGRININTAPSFVLRALPWISDTVADGIVYDRGFRQKAFRGIGDLMRVYQVSKLDDDDRTAQFNEPNDAGFYDYPDFTSDSSVDDLEESHLLFSAISNLITVRSDVFSAYIIVRIGPDGPQRRVYALLDRSEVTKDGGRVKVVIQQNVPDPR